MSVQQEVRIGLFGFGVVGKGFFDLIQRVEGWTISRIAVKRPAVHKDIELSVLALHPDDIVQNGDIDVVVEAIDDAEAAFRILKQALANGKPVITANKKMIAAHLPEIIELQNRFGVPVLYEAACCAGLPVIRNVQDYYSGLVASITGIINGSTNYMLTAMERYRFRFNHALQLAQEAGFAESDASLDVEGKDAAFKLSILLKHLWGIHQSPGEIIHTGIQNILPQDLRLAEQTGGVLKLVAHAQKTSEAGFVSYILPKLVLRQDILHTVAHEYNGLVIKDVYGDEHLLYGKGSGGRPTAMGLWNDLQALSRHYRYQYREATGSLVADYAGKDLYVHVTVPSDISLPTGIDLTAYSSDSRYTYYAGKIDLQDLNTSSWWKEKGISLIDISEISETEEEDPLERLRTVVELRKDIFQPV